MIFTRLGPAVPFYRALTPSWAYLPESGAGAARVGGRFNRPGVEARYLAASTAGALFEYQQESPLLPPATLATHLVAADRVVDVTGGYQAETWSPIWAEAYCEWKRLAFDENTDPPSWVIGDLVREAGAAGLLYRSVRDSSQVCLVLYPELAHLFTAPVHDPDGKLPRNAESWRT